MIETIKEYLVSLGFKTDDSSLNAAKAAMGKAEDSVAKFANSSVKSFAKAATGVVTFVATANLALGKFIVELAQADLQTEMFAQKMWMSKDAAKAYQSSIDALGVSINDLYLSPELMNKYLELNKLAREMAVPSNEYTNQMRNLREITFEFQKLKLEGTYALQWIGFYLTKILAGPLGDFKKWLAGTNESIQKNMPKWTEKVALVASWFVRLGLAAWKVRDAIGAIMLAFTGFKMIGMLTNPFGLMVLGLTALLLLVDDYTAWQNDKSGKNSVFNDLWESLDKFKKSLEDDGTIGKFKNLLQGAILDIKKFGDWLEKTGQSKTFKKFLSDSNDLILILWHGIENTWNWLVDLGEQLDDSGSLDSFGESLGETWGSVVDLTDAIGDLLNSLGGEGGLGDLLTSGIISALNVFTGTLEEIAGLVTIIAGGIKGITTGDFSGLEKGAELFKKGLSRALDNPIGNALRGETDSKDEVDNKLKKAMTPRPSHTSDSKVVQGGTTPVWSPFKNSMPETNTDTPSVNWGTLKTGFMTLLDSIKPASVSSAQPNNTIQNQSHYQTENTHNQTTNNSHYYSENPQEFKPDIAPVWSSFKNSIPGANTDASTVDWSALKKGFVGFMNSIPKEFGDIAKGLFQTAKGYGDSGAIAGAGAMNYLYPQTTTSSMSQVSVKQTYHIYGASNPEATATTVNRTSTAALTRHFQGGVR